MARFVSHPDDVIHTDGFYEVAYRDKERLHLRDTAMVLNVGSVRCLVGSTEGFMKLYNLRGVTNGKLLVLTYGAPDPYAELSQVIENCLSPERFLPFHDYLLFVQKNKHVDDVLRKLYSLDGVYSREDPPWLEKIKYTNGDFDLYHQQDPRYRWVNTFLDDPSWGKIRFKVLVRGGYPLYHVPRCLVDEVGLDEFRKVEKRRLPLFVGSQFGINPRPNEVFEAVDPPRQVGIICKSVLSGFVAGLAIDKMNGEKRDRLWLFSNH